jgi:hypothetical protein
MRVDRSASVLSPESSNPSAGSVRGDELRDVDGLPRVGKRGARPPSAETPASLTHRTIKCTPAMEAGVLPSALTVADLVDMAA